MKLNHRIIICGSIFLIFCIFTLIPTTHGYGTSFSDAMVVTNGTYNEVISGTAFYKINCAMGDSLTVATTPLGGADVNLYLYDPMNHQEGDYLCNSTLGAGQMDQCMITCGMGGDYYIVVVKITSGSVSFTLTITKTTGVPGFELLYALFSLISLIGLMVFLKKKL